MSMNFTAKKRQRFRAALLVQLSDKDTLEVFGPMALVMRLNQNFTSCNLLEFETASCRPVPHFSMMLEAARAFAVKEMPRVWNAHLIAAQFIHNLQRYLTEEEFKDVCERSEADGLFCPSHDYCDANMVMHESIEQLGLEWSVVAHDCGWNVAARRMYAMGLPA